MIMSMFWRDGLTCLTGNSVKMKREETWNHMYLIIHRTMLHFANKSRFISSIGHENQYQNECRIHESANVRFLDHEVKSVF